MWYPLLIMVIAAILSATAARAAGKQKPNHPLVGHPSKLGVGSFLLATVAYTIAGVFLVREQEILAIVFGIIGLIACSLGVVAQKS